MTKEELFLRLYLTGEADDYLCRKYHVESGDLMKTVMCNSTSSLIKVVNDLLQCTSRTSREESYCRDYVAACMIKSIERTVKTGIVEHRTTPTMDVMRVKAYKMLSDSELVDYVYSVIDRYVDKNGLLRINTVEKILF